MYPSSFDYYRASSVREAVELREEHESGSVEWLSGGHSLLPTMKTGLAAPDVLIDIGGIESLRGIEERGDGVWIGANTRYAEVARSALVREVAPAVYEAAGAIGDIQVRNRGTVGGNIAHSDPASDLPGAVLASAAEIHVEGAGGERVIPADEFFVGMYETAVEEDEVLTGVEVPGVGSDGAGVYVKKASPSSGYAMVGVAVVLTVSGGDGVIESARVAANGAFECARRLEGVEEALVGREAEAGVGESIRDEATSGVEEFELLDDLQASSGFRGQLLRVFTGRGIDRAVDQL